MAHKNRFYHGSKLSEKKFREILRYFALDFTAADTARLSGVSIRSINDLYLLLRHRIYQHCQTQSPFSGVVECDEAYFGPTRVRGKRGRGAGGKTIVFGLLKREGNVYTEIVPDCSKPTLQRIIRGHADPSCIVNTDGWRGYDGLVDVGFDKHLRVNHGNSEFVRGNSHVNGIESFWSFAKRRFVKFNGVAKHTFHLHLKETEFRFNHRKSGTYKALLNLIAQQPLLRSAS